MRRRVFTLLSALSLVLCLATVGLWVRSHWVMEQISWSGAGGVEWIDTPIGNLMFGAARVDASKRPRSEFGFRHRRDQAIPPFNYLPLMNSDPGDKNLMWERGGFAWYSRSEARTGNLHVLIMAPFWFIMAALAVLPAVWTIRWSRRRGQNSEHICVACGYDLRATPQRCPECGLVPAGAMP